MLFLGFVYFVVGQAAATRNGAQTAADAAALAAAQDARDQLREGWLDVILEPTQWDGYLHGKGYRSSSACDHAADFAARNGATLEESDCDPLLSELQGFSVTVHTTGTVGRSLIPGTDLRHATASAKAVIEPKCLFMAPEVLIPEEPDPEPEPITGLTCDGKAWTIDPDDPTLPSASDLFTVRLAGDNE